MENVTVRQLVNLLNKEENMTGGATGKERILALEVNGEYRGHATSVKLDGWGDGLITDVCLEVTTNLADKEIVANKNKEDNDLLPCPFCGGNAKFFTKRIESSHCDLGFSFGIECEKCGCELPKTYTLRLTLGTKGNIVAQIDERKEALTDWNRRIYE